MIWDVNFQNYTENLVPPDKRTFGFLGWIWSLIRAIQWRFSINYVSYCFGSNDPPYSLSQTYVQGQRVRYLLQAGGSYYGDNAVYEANTNVPANTPPTINNLVNSNGVGYWIKVQPNFIGSYLRQMFTSQKKIFEYALNLWFSCTFRNNPNTSDIYIVGNTVNQGQFFTGGVNNSYSFPSGMTRFIFPGWSSSQLYSFTIYFPINAYNALYNQAPVTAGNNTTQRDAIVRAFANLYSPAAAVYKIITY